MSLKKLKALQWLRQTGVIAVVRARSAHLAIKAVDAIVAGGIKGIEITYTTPDAAMVIKELKAKYKQDNSILIGAGTVLESVSCIEAIKSGALFVVAPSFDEQSAKMCNLYQTPYLPGCISPTEIQTAMQFGSDIVKLFPGSAFSPSYIKALKAPLPQANIMPTGGVNLENIEAWFKSGAVAVGIGGDLLAPLEHEDFQSITNIAQKYAQKYASINHKYPAMVSQ